MVEPAQLTNVEYIKICIKERLKAASLHISDERVEATIQFALGCDQNHSCVRYIAELTRDCDDKICHELVNNHAIPRTDTSANILLGIFHQEWCRLSIRET